MLLTFMRAARLLIVTATLTAGCYRPHSLGEGGLPDASVTPVRDASMDSGRDTLPVPGCRSDLECPAPPASCARAFCFDSRCGVTEIPVACPFDSVCDFTRGCLPLTPDAFRLDTGIPDAFRPDTGVPDAFRPDTGLPDAFTIDTGPPLVGSAIRCSDGTVLRVPSHTQLDFGPTATIELWLRARAAGTIAVKGSRSGAHVFHLRIEPDATGSMSLVGGWGLGAMERLVSVPYGDRMGVWTHVALVQRDLGDTVALSIVLDGVLAATATVTDDFSDADNSLDLRMCMLDADMDEIRLWRVVREEGSITLDLRRTLPSGIMGLSAYWPLDGIGQIVLDRSLHGAEGVLGETSDAESTDPARTPDGAF